MVINASQGLVRDAWGRFYSGLSRGLAGPIMIGISTS